MSERKHTLRILRNNTNSKPRQPARVDSAAAVVRTLFWSSSDRPRRLRLVK
ncbi:MAG: hypothetical protein ICCCNLDF_03695 [Planctomycetes bacterium]|nr:hypothetical protein [Planctomycetota bacterium]